MDKFFEFISKARYPVVFLVLGLILALAAAARTIKILGIELSPYSLTAHAGLGLVALAMLGLGVLMVFRDGAGAQKPAGKPKYDVFLAAPMAGAETEAEYEAIRSLSLEVLALMRAHCGVSSYYFVGEKLETKAQFESYDVAAEKDFDAISVSRNFVLIYPRRMVSSVIAEVGFALARNIPSTLFTAMIEDLPYLLKQAGELPHNRYPPVHVRPYGTPSKLKQMIRNDGAALFPSHVPAPGLEDAA